MSYRALALACLLTATALAQNSAVDTVRARQHELEDALIHADMAKLDRMLTPDFIRTPPGGQDTDKAAYAVLIKSGRLHYISFADTDEKYRAFGNTVIVNVLSKLHTQSSGGPDRETTLKLIWVWVLRDGEWQLAAVEGTNVTPPR